MRIRLFTLSVFLALASPALTHAQNVLVPSDSSSATQPITSVTAPPAPKMSTPVQPPAPKPSSLENLLKNSPPITSSLTTPAPVYLPTDMQNYLIQTEQKKLSHFQQSLASLQQAKQAPETAQNQQQKTMASFMESSGQGTAMLSEQIQKSQERLAILQSGPLTANDLKALALHY